MPRLRAGVFLLLAGGLAGLDLAGQRLNGGLADGGVSLRGRRVPPTARGYVDFDYALDIHGAASVDVVYVNNPGCISRFRCPLETGEAVGQT